MENYNFENLQIDHQYYDNVELMLSAVSSSDLSLNFKREIDKTGGYFLYHIFEKPLASILGMENYKPSDIHTLLSFAKDLDIEFGKLPEWFLPFKTNRDKDSEKRFLHSKLWKVAWPRQEPSLSNKEYRMLSEQFKVERVYQFLRIDRGEVAKVKFTGKKILESLDYFIDRNDISDLKLSIKE